MPKPTPEQLAMALAEAKRLREQREDRHYLARALLHCQYEARFLWQVVQAAENYLHSGLAEQEHTGLLQALQQLREVDARTEGREDPTFGL